MKTSRLFNSPALQPPGAHPGKKLVIASVLKPVNDTRMYEKFALSLCQLFGEVHLIGAAAGELPTSVPSNVFFHPVSDFHRLSSRRLGYSLLFYRLLNELSPDVLIVNTAELLLPALCYKFSRGTTLIYDVMENYYRNVLYQSTYPRWLRLPLAVAVRLFEYVSRPCIDHYLLAERNYEQEFSFSKDKSTVVENKYKPLHGIAGRQRVLRRGEKLRFLYSGTVSRTYGTSEAIGFIKKMHLVAPEVELLVIGFCSDDQYLEELFQLAGGASFITLDVQKKPVPHSRIIAAIETADVALLPYQFNKSTINCIPTKMYEYMAHRLPMILPGNTLWQQVVAPWRAGFSIDYRDFSPVEVYHQLTDLQFYTALPPGIYWRDEEQKLITVLRKYIPHDE